MNGVPHVPFLLYLCIAAIVISRQLLIRAIKRRIPEVWSRAGTTFPYLEVMYLRRRKEVGSVGIDFWMLVELLAWTVVIGFLVSFLVHAQRFMSTS